MGNFYRREAFTEKFLSEGRIHREISISGNNSQRNFYWWEDLTELSFETTHREISIICKSSEIDKEQYNSSTHFTVHFDKVYELATN